MTVYAVMEFRRRDTRDKLTERTRYIIDRAVPGMLHAAVLGARVAVGRLMGSTYRRPPRCRACATPRRDFLAYPPQVRVAVASVEGAFGFNSTSPSNPSPRCWRS